MADKRGYTSLHVAAQLGNVEAATLLLERDARIDAVEKVSCVCVCVCHHVEPNVIYLSFPLCLPPLSSPSVFPLCLPLPPTRMAVQLCTWQHWKATTVWLPPSSMMGPTSMPQMARDGK